MTKTTKKPPQTIKVSPAGARLLARGAELLDTFCPLHHEWETQQRIKRQIEAFGSADQALDVNAEDYIFGRRFIGGLRALMVSGALSTEDEATASKIHADYMATRAWDKDTGQHERRNAAEWRLRVWLVDYGYGQHVNREQGHGQGMPPGAVALIDRWRADVDGQHVMAVYDDCVREATFTAPYNYGSWRIISTKPYQTSSELDAILRPFVTKPGTTWDAAQRAASEARAAVAAKSAQMSLDVDPATIAALQRAVAVRLDASDADVKLVRAFMANLRTKE